MRRKMNFSLLEHRAVRACLLVALMVTPALGLATTSEDASAWLGKMGNALKKESYEGIFTYMRGYQFNTIKVVHEYKDNKEFERLISLNGPQREMIRTGNKLVFRREKSDTSDIDQMMPLGPFTHAFNDNLARNQDFYHFAVIGKGRVAGLPAVELSITPKNDDRYGYRLWLDEKTGLLLQSHLVNRGHVLEVFQFSEVKIGGTIKQSEFDNTMKDAVTYQILPAKTSQPGEASNKPGWRAGWLPSGFHLVSRESPNRLLYSDGIATFSVFVDHGSASSSGELVTHMGGTVVITRRLKGSSQQITVVGEVPIGIARKVADSVEQVLY